MIIDRNPQVHSPGRHGVGRPKPFDSYESSPRGKVYKQVNGFSHTTEKAVDFATVHPPLQEASQEIESCQPLDAVPSPGSQNGESVYVVNDDRYSKFYRERIKLKPFHSLFLSLLFCVGICRLSIQSYRLKDDEDFPPLSG